ncbi:MAG: type II toxin-antitoxin system PemK/MazF family toxin [Bifidobacteriaceae bacterium]|jgi:mRNA interferase MazF|nr:type II toxin-antitoxin system PemK/MazF family toxin [Bifidobacteriaceae bacterium]
MNEPKAGEVWVGAGGSYLSKPRPVVIMQSEKFVALNSVTVCPVTSEPTSSDLPLFRLELPPVGTGLETRSWAMADKVTTIPKAKLGTKTGTVPRATMRQLLALVATFLGVAD